MRFISQKIFQLIERPGTQLLTLLFGTAAQILFIKAYIGEVFYNKQGAFSIFADKCL